MLSGAEAGTANAFSYDVSGLSGGTTPLLSNQQAATDASLTIDGLAVTASSNNPDDVISGLTLDLLQADVGKTINVKVGVDTEGVSENVKGFVDAYNDLFSYINDQNANDGDLRNNPTLRSVASRIENIFASSLQGGAGDITMFAQVGISRGEGRQLEWSESDFLEALEDDFNSVRDLFVEREGQRR